MSANMPLLLSCPFCRGQAEYRRAEDEDFWSVDCTMCGNHTSWCKEPGGAAKAWNQRPEEDAPKLHPMTRDLVARFAAALAEKLSMAEQKYGYSDNWASPSWMDDCRLHLREHVEKGDPRDVAAYCAFLWHHGEKTVCEQRTAISGGALEVIDSAAWLLANDSGERYAAPLREVRYLIANLMHAAQESVRDAAPLSATSQQLKAAVSCMGKSSYGHQVAQKFFDNLLAAIPTTVKGSAYERDAREAQAVFSNMVSALQQVVRDWRHPYDSGEYEDGEMPALDAARAALARAGAHP